MAGCHNRHRRVTLEGLSARLCLAADLLFSGPDTLGASNVNVSADSGTTLERIQSEMSIDANPHPAFSGNLVGISHALGTFPPYSDARNFSLEIDVFFSLDAGASWKTRRLSDATRTDPALDTVKVKHINDGLDKGYRFDPTMSIDASTGYVYIGYSVWFETLQSLVVGRSTDAGDTWQFSVATSVAVAPMSSNPRLDKFHVATGSDPSQVNGRAVYITYTDKEGLDTVRVAGTNYSGANWQNAQWTQQDVSNNPGELSFPDPAVGPSGELYVAWIDYAAEGKIMIDVDRDGMFANQHQFQSDTVVRSLVSDFQSPFFVPAQPGRSLTNALMLDVDVSSNPLTRGRLYVTFIDHRDTATKTGDPNDVDVFVGRLQPPASGPLTGWSLSAVEGDTTTDFNPWLDVDQVNGRVSLVYYRSLEKNGGTDQQVHVYVRNSFNGGPTFGARTRLSAVASKVSDVAEDGDYNRDYLEYIGLAAHAGKIHVLWAQVNYADFDAPRGDLEAYYTSASITALAGRRLDVRADEHVLAATESIVIGVITTTPLTFSVDVGGQRQFEGLASDVDEIFIEGLEKTNDPLTSDTVIYPSNTQLRDKIHVAPIAKVVLVNPNSISAGDGSEMRFVVTAPPGRFVRLFVNNAPTSTFSKQLGPTEQQAEFTFKVCGRTQQNPTCTSVDDGVTKWWRGSIDGQVIHITHATSSTAAQKVPLTKLRVGDFNRDAAISAADIDLLIHHIVRSIANAELDFDRDNDVDVDDLEEFVNLVLRTYFGDANLDGIFDSSDLVEVLAVGEYEDSTGDNSGWADGDWDGDQDFGSSDLVIAFADGGYTE
jgi:hypothetical protein